MNKTEIFVIMYTNLLNGHTILCGDGYIDPKQAEAYKARLIQERLDEGDRHARYSIYSIFVDVPNGAPWA